MELWGVSLCFCGGDVHSCATTPPPPSLTALWRGGEPAESGVSGEGAARCHGRLPHGRKNGVEEGQCRAGGEPPAGPRHERYAGRVQGLPLGAPLLPVCRGEEHHWWTGRPYWCSGWGLATSAFHLLLLSGWKDSTTSSCSQGAVMRQYCRAKKEIGLQWGRTR